MSNEFYISVKLSIEELASIDAELTDPSAMTNITMARKAILVHKKHPDLPLRQAFMLVRIESNAISNGRIGYRRTSIRECPCCGYSAGYAKHTRTSVYHKRGETNYKRPLYIPAFDLSTSPIGIKGVISLGYCENCKTDVPKDSQITTLIDKFLETAKIEVPAHWTGVPHKWRRFDRVICSKCTWEGHEGEMFWERTILNDGKYPACCPRCLARNDLGNIKIQRVKGFEIVPMAQAAEMIKKRVPK